MTTKIADYIDVSAKILNIGCEHPEGLSILPLNFGSAASFDEFQQLSETLTVKTIMATKEFRWH